MQASSTCKCKRVSVLCLPAAHSTGGQNMIRQAYLQATSVSARDVARSACGQGTAVMASFADGITLQGSEAQAHDFTRAPLRSTYRSDNTAVASIVEQTRPLDNSGPNAMQILAPTCWQRASPWPQFAATPAEAAAGEHWSETSLPSVQ